MTENYEITEDGYTVVYRKAADGHNHTVLSPNGVSVAREKTLEAAVAAIRERSAR